MEKYSSPDPVNISAGNGVSIAELARHIGDVTGYKGKVLFDMTKPDGMLRKILDNRRIAALGWKASPGLRPGLEKTYAWFLKERS